MAFRLNKLAQERLNSKKRSKQQRQKHLKLELLEERRLLAVGPQLLGIDHANGVLIQEGSSHQTAPGHLTFRFEEGQILDANALAGIRLVRSGSDYIFDNANDIVVQPGFVGLGQNASEVIMRFSQTLPDDAYRITIFGAGPGALRNMDGFAFNDLTDDGIDNGVNLNLQFNLALGAQIISVVPQPIVRDPLTGALSQSSNQIEVYFNNDELNVASVTNPAYYRLINTHDQSVLFPQSVGFDATKQMATLNFAENLSMGTFHLQIGVSEEFNGSIDSATNLGTVSQKAISATYSSPVQLDADGNPIVRAIPDGTDSVVSVISVLDPTFISDLNVEVDIDHAWGPDLRIFLQGPGGQRVEMVRDLGSDIAGGQIYGVRFNDLDGDGVRDPNEPNLPGWTIFIDSNLNGKLDAGERSTVTDSQGRYAFIGLELDRTYTLGSQPQARWQQTSPVGGGEQRLFHADFSDGSVQSIRFSGNPQQGDFRLGFGTRVTELIQFAGPTNLETTASNIQTALAAIVDPGITVTVINIAPSPQTNSEFLVSFRRTGINTPFDHPVLGVVVNNLNVGLMSISTIGAAEGFTSFGPNNQWNLSTNRGADAGHTGLNSFYFGSGGTSTGGGAYVNNANGTLLSPVIDLTDPTIDGDVNLRFNHLLQTEFDFDFATVNAVVGGVRTQLLRTSTSTTGFTPIQLDLTAFVGQRVQLEFNFTSDSSIVEEGWFVDDIQISAVRGMQQVTLSTGPQGSVVKDINFGGTRGPIAGPDSFGYEAYRVTTDFDNISTTGSRVFQEFDGVAYVQRFGGTGNEQGSAITRDTAGNFYVTGMFQGSVTFGPGPGAATLNSVGNSDIFIAKLSDAGEVLWVRRAGGSQADAATAIAIDSAGSVYLTGSFQGTADFGPGSGSLTSSGNSDAFILKLSSDGNFQWVKRLGGTGADGGTGIAIDSAGNIVSAGFFSGTVDMNPNGGVNNLTSAGNTDIYVTKLDNDGNFVWARRAGSTAADRAAGVVVDSNNAIIVTGSYTGTVDFDPGPTNSATTSAGGTDAFVWKLESNGNFAWVNRLGNTANDRGSAVAVDDDRNIYFTGSVANGLHIARISASGILNWENNFTSTGTNAGESIVVTPNQKVAVTGAFRGTISPLGAPLLSSGGTDIVLLGMNTNGQLEFARQSGGAQDDSGFGLTYDNSNNFVLTGAFRGSASFDLSAEVVTSVSAGSSDIFIAKSLTVQIADDETVHLTAAALNGFRFPFYGTTYDELYFSSNGLITFGSPNASAANTNLADPPQQASIAAFWEDFVVGTSDLNAVYWEVTGTGANQQLILQWNNVVLKSPTGLSNITANFQAVLSADGTIQFNYVDVPGPQIVPAAPEAAVGTFTKGDQSFSNVAADASGNYIAVWQSNGQDGDGAGVFGRRFNAAGSPLGDEFQVNVTTEGDQFVPRVASNPNGQFVVVWSGNGIGDAAGIFARVYDPSGAPLTSEIRVNATVAGSQSRPDVEINSLGDFIVVWDGESTSDIEGISARRFSPLGIPLDAQDEVQEIEILGPPNQFSSFTLVHAGEVTGAIVYSGAGQALVTASNIQTALRALNNTGNTLTVTPRTTSEVQTLLFTGNPTGGTFSLVFGAQTTDDIVFAGAGQGTTTANNIQTALRGLPALGNQLVVTSLSDFEYEVHFLGLTANTDVPLLAIGTDGLLPDAAGLTVTETIKGVAAADSNTFIVTFRGVDGSQNQPLLVHGNRAGGVTHTRIRTVTEGSTGEYLINNVLTSGQSQARIETGVDGQYVVTWTSNLQDGSLLGVYGKQLDTDGQPTPTEVNEIQTLSIAPNSNTGSQFRLNLGGALTGFIGFAGPNQGAVTAANIQAALQPIAPGVVVNAIPGNSVAAQRITFSGATTGGTFQIAHAGLETGAITFAGAANPGGTATNIQNALNALANLAGTPVVVTPFGATPNGLVFDVVFANSAGIAQPLLFLTNTALVPGGSSLTIAEISLGGLSNSEFAVTFAGASGRTNQPLLLEAGSAGGFLGLTVTETVAGNSAEFPINTQTINSQSSASSTRRADGSFVVTWQSQLQDGDGLGIFADILDASGNSLTGEFGVNTFTQSGQQAPVVAAATDGSFAIVWQSNLQDGSAQGVFVRLFTADGTPLGDEINVPELTTGSQTQPSLAALPDGNYVITWTTVAGTGGIHSRIIGSNGVFVNSESDASTFGVRSQAAPSIAQNAAGDYVVVWSDTRRDNTNLPDIYAQVFDRDGNARTGEILVNELQRRRQARPEVSIDDAGNFVVAWTTEVEVIVNGVTTVDQDVRARLFDIAGLPLTSEILVNTQTAELQDDADVAINPATGEFIVVWENLTGDVQVRAQRFDNLGNPQGANFLVSATTEAGRVGYDAAVASNAAGQTVIIWNEDNEFFSSGQITYRLFGNNGEPLTGNLRASELPSAGDLVGDVAMASDGSFAMTWIAAAGDIYLRLFDAAGQPSSSQTLVNSGGSISDLPRISVSSTGEYTVVWTSFQSMVFAQRFTASGLTLGGNILINTTALAGTSSPVVTGRTSGEYVVGWLDDRADRAGQQDGLYVQQMRVDTSSVGIKATGTQLPNDNILPIWVDGSATQLVGAGVSTRISPKIVVPERVFAVDANLNRIVELDAVTGSTLRTVPAPGVAGPDAGLAYANNTLYFLASAATTIQVIDPSDGAILRSIPLPSPPASSGLAYLDGHIVVQDALTDELLFIHTTTGEIARRVAPAASIVGGLVGSGSRNTLFGVNPQSELVEINPLDGTILRTLVSPGANLSGLAFVAGQLVVASRDGRIRRVDANNGAILAEFQVSANLVALGGDGAGGVHQAYVGNYQPLTGTILDDEGSVSITAGTGPYTGRYRPVESLTAFDQTNANGIWRLEVQDTQSGDTGVLNGWKLRINERQDTPADVQYTGFIGDYVPAGAVAVNDVDIYRFDVLAPGTITIELAPVQGLDGAVRLFNAQGVQVASANSGSTGEHEILTFEATAAGRFFVGVSSAGNESYNALNGSGATGGSSTGKYEILIDFSTPLTATDDNSSFADATNLGTLGVAGQVVRAEIRSNPSTLAMPGGNDEPGHRHIPAETHLNASGAAPQFTPNRLLIAFNATATPAQRAQFLSARGLSVAKRFNFNDTLVIETLPGADLVAQLRDLKASSLIKFAELDERVQSTALFPNDPSFSQLWGLHNVGQSGGTIDADIDAPEAWELYTGGTEVVIAVIDSGIDYTHPDLISNLWINPGEIPGNGLDDDGNGYIDDIFGIDTINGDSDPMDGDSHGTHVAGTIAGVGNNGTGVTGVNWNAKIMSLKFLDDDGFGSTAAAIEAIDYMVTMKTQYGVNLVVSNNSWGGGGFSQALQDAIGSSINAGILFVAAAGNFAINNDVDPFYPASYALEGIISVAATDRNDQLANFSHFGQTSVDIAAPGVSILSTVPGGGYALFDGTSMASPHVAGVAALLAGYSPGTSVIGLKQAILGGADVLPNLNGTSVTGGRLNAAQSMALMGSSSGGPLGRSTVTAFYNFQDFYGILPSGDVPSNAITENQKARAREVFELYGHFLGIQFIETANQGLTVVTGDMRAMDPTIAVGPGGVAGLSEGSLVGRVIMDAAENWGDSPYGGGWFQVAMHEIGHSMGLGHTYDLPNLTIMGGFGPGEAVFPGDHDLIHGRILYPNHSNDIDLYQFNVTDAGWFTAETIAERLQPNASLVNTAITLYRESSVGGTTTRQLIARNDDYFSNDSYMRLRLQPGTYFIGVTSTGIENVDPVIANTGFGGTTEGTYELALGFEPDPMGNIRDTQGVALDGDADGTPGGVLNFWFESGPAIIVDKLHNPTSAIDGDGSLSSPFDNIQSALDAARTTLVIPNFGGAGIEDGESFVITDGLNAPVTFEFNSTDTTRPGQVAINFTVTDSREVIAEAIVAAIAQLQTATPPRLGVTATAANGLVRLAGAASLDISGAPALLSSPNIVRIVGNGGTDGLTSTLADNLPYLVGLDTNGNPLSDGSTLEVPQGVTLMIDGGTLVKLSAANIDVGSSSLVTDRRHGAIQVLGAPDNLVSFYSYRDDAVGGDSDGPSLGARGGDWGGLVMRADSDMEEKGIFLNWVNHAELVQGGGKLTVGSVEEQFTPIYMVGARPTVSFTNIRGSADAAMSADPRSFEDTMGRAGPKLHGNLIESNTINGLFVRIRTELGRALDTFDLPSRWSNTEIVHVVTENLIISAALGGPEIDPQTGLIKARLDGRLAIDPGVVVKLGGARMESQIGAQLIAEGTLEKPIVFTSITDDSYGGSGTFDTTNDAGNTAPAPGQWGGLVFGATAKGSLDFATLKFAGGLTPIEGNFDFFNPIEIHQADVRIANSLLMNNANGRANGDRNGRGTNTASTIFVRGAQPIIVDNTIRDNAGSVININANSLQATRQADYGRTTGPLNEYREFTDNRGPLVRANRLQNNGLNGMEVRGAVLTTESVWDDTDIVHILRDEITLLNHHTFSGLRLQSSENESLVVKLAGANAGFTANGTLLDIDDRIGGSLYVVATPGRPVIFTSLTDDSATAGFNVSGQPVGDTNNNGPSTGSPGQWRSLLLNHLSNDRNVELVLELEPAFSGTTEQNGAPANAQFLGNLAPNEKSGDINRRLGFEIHGNISVDRPTDADVYSFIGVAGTEVWLDIDRTNAGLDTVLELINENGGLLARSTGNKPEDLTGLAMPITKEAYLGGDFYTINPRDAGMRVVLPGVQGQSSTYFVRVRSKPAEDRLENIAAGLTRGEYQLQIRLRQVDEKPGSTIRGADIRFATTGIEVIGLPAHSPLISESAESANNNENLGAAQPLGNLLTTNRNVLSVGGNLSASTDVDWYSFSLDYDLIQAIAGTSATGNTWSTIFDIDYADGIARPDTVLSVFDAAGNLILVSRDSNIADDQPGAGQGLDTDDLSRGSFGTLDPFIGSVQMPTGSVALNPPTTYYVAVSSNSQLPLALNATFAAAANNPFVRLEPVNSVRRVAEDHIGFSGYATSVPPALAPVNPTTQLFNISTAVSLATNVLPFSLSDVVLYVGNPGANGLRTVNPSTGAVVTNVADLPNNPTAAGDFVMRSDGRMFMVEGIFGPGNAIDNTAGRLVEINPNTGAQTVIGNDNIPNFDAATNPPNPQQLTSNNINSLAFLRTSDAPEYDLYYAVEGIRTGANTVGTGSTLYRANPANGSAAVADGQPWGLRGGIFEITPGDVGRTTGMAFVNGQLFGVSDTGRFYRINIATGRAFNVVSVGGSFSGLALGPQNVQGGAYANLLFAISPTGDLRALDTSGAPQSIFAGGATTVATGVPATGLAFSPLDFNLWHPTLQRRADAGHGINASFDLSRGPSSVARDINGRTVSEAEGGASFYFGLENWVSDPTSSNYFTYGTNAQLGISSQNFHRDLTSNPTIGGNYNLPGGATGSLATNSFSLANSSFGDKPTLYFNYFLETENANAATNAAMRDSARVQISNDGGATWQLLATNNSVLSTAGTLAELPRFVSPSVNASTHPRQRVQELFDNTGQWRQARVDLSEFAGTADLLIRFDFATSGSMNQGLASDAYGNFNNREKALNNTFEGFYIDDVIIGFAERGEMVTGATGQSQYFTIPQNPNANDPRQVLVGDYQLEIRRGTEYGTTVTTDGDIAIVQTFDTNARMIPSLRRLGDINAVREQGQVLIAGNSIQNTSVAGILVDAGVRGVNGNLPRPGSVIRTPTINTQRLVPGVHIENNLVTEFGQAGIIFSGDNAPNLPLAAVPFGRIVNNTIYGDETARGTGILVRNNASPTILNNIVSNAVTGISVDASSASTVIGANLFKGNGANGSIGENALLLQANNPLFVNPSAGNYYLALGSSAIDSSINSLADRPNFDAVKAPLGIPTSPILAPDRDRYNQLRLDDPSQDPPPGLGSNIFKDRGAIERADFVGPFARLVNPVDNDALGIDLNPDANHVLLNQPILSRIVIQLVDPGIGIDDTTVTASTVSVTLDGVALVSGVDYDFSYNVTNNLIILTSLANNGPVSSTYVVTLDNAAATGIKDEATNALARNEASGLTRFTIETEVIDIAENLPDFQIPSTELTVLEDNEAELGLLQTEIPDFATDIVIPGSDGANVIFFTTLSYSNPGLFEEPPTIDPSGTLRFKTAQDRNGSSVVIVQLADAGLGGTASPTFSVPKTFTISLTPVNDAPQYSIGSVANVNEDQGLVSLVGYASQILPGPVTAEDEVVQNVAFVVAAVDPSSFTVQPTISSAGTLQFQTASDRNSDTANFDITVYLIDTGSDVPTNINRSETQTLSIIVNPINDSPTYTLAVSNVEVIEDVEAFENIARVVVPGVVTNAAPGPITAIDEIGQLLNYQVVSVNAPQLFEVQPTLTAGGALTFKTAANQNGTALVVIQLFDDGATAPQPNNNASVPQTLTITIRPVNDAPQFLLTGSSTTAEDAGLVSIPSFATNILRGPANAQDESGQTVNFIVTALDPSSFQILPSISSTGTLTFQTAANVNSLNADLRIAVALRDSGASSPLPNANQSATVTTTLNIVPVNDPPILSGFTASVTEDTPVTILASAVLGNARPGPTVDEDSQSLSITLMELVTSSGGLVTPIYTGTTITSFTYAPGKDYVGADTILYVVTDNGTPNRSATGTITLTISGVNDAPTFVAGPSQAIEEDAAAVTVENWATNILQGPVNAVDELANQTLSFDVVTNRPELFEQLPAVSSEGTLTFKAAVDANGAAIVTVTAVDSGPGNAPNVNRSVTQTFTIAIAPVNDAPGFTPGPHVTVDEDSGAYAQPWATAIAPATGMLLTPPQALDEAGQTVRFELVVSQPSLFVQQPAVSANGQLTFATAANAYGVSTVVVTAVDSGPTGGTNVSRSATTTMTISLTSVNDQPVAVNDAYSIDENSVLSVASRGLLLNDRDVDLPNDSLQVVGGDLQSALGAQVTLNADGSFSYDPRQVASINELTVGQNISDSFTYRIQDRSGAFSEMATVTINVSGVDDPPFAENDSFVVATGTARILNVLANDVEIDTPIDANTVTLSQQPVFGTVVVNSGGSVTYTPGPGFRGNDTFAYRVRDIGGNLSNEATVSIAVNSPPVANNDTVFTFKNTPVDIDVLANDTDPDSALNPSSVEIVVSPSTGGTATVLEDGRIRFSPATDFAGQVQLSYVVSDNLGTPSNVANVSIRVQNSRWQNPSGSLDVSGDGFVSPIDVLLIINYLNSGQPTFLPNANVTPPPFLDPSGDERVSPLDIVLIVNYLNIRAAGGEGEGGLTAEAESATSTTFAMMVTPTQMIDTVGAAVVREVQSRHDESFASTLTNPMRGNASDDLETIATPLFNSGLDEDDDELLEMLSCSADEFKQQSLRSAVDSFFGEIGPKRPK